MKRVLASLSATIASLVLLLGFKTHSPVITPTTSTSRTTDPATTSSPSTTLATSSTIDGNEVSTKWGPVKVQIVVSNGRITKVVALEYPDTNNRDISINKRAIPTLISQTLQAQSADIAGVSGATYTTDGFVTSLQSALNKSTVE